MENFRLDEPAFRTAMARSMVAPLVTTPGGSGSFPDVRHAPRAPGRRSQGAQRPARGRIDRGPRLRIAAELEADQRVVVLQGRVDEVLVAVTDGDERLRGGREG